MSDLSGRVAVVTGAGNGIGAVYARHLAEHGAHAVVADIDGDAAAAVAASLPSASTVTLDITDVEACVSAVDAVVAEHGSIDILVNNAGFYRGRDFPLAEEIDLGMWQKMIDVNISGTYYMCRAAIPHMKHQGSGVIINQSSASAHAAGPRSLHYSMTKGASITMTKTMARELGAFGVRVNAIAPGLIDTDATRSVVPDDVVERASGNIALQRVGTPEDLAPLLVFLCSDGASYITGQTYIVDGGITMLG